MPTCHIEVRFSARKRLNRFAKMARKLRESDAFKRIGEFGVRRVAGEIGFEESFESPVLDQAERGIDENTCPIRGTEIGWIAACYR